MTSCNDDRAALEATAAKVEGLQNQLSECRATKIELENKNAELTRVAAAHLARAKEAEAAKNDLVSRAQKILDALNADYSKPTDGDDKWKGGFDDGIKTAASLVHAFISHALLASLKEGQ